MKKGKLMIIKYIVLVLNNNLNITLTLDIYNAIGLLIIGLLAQDLPFIDHVNRSSVKIYYNLCSALVIMGLECFPHYLC